MERFIQSFVFGLMLVLTGVTAQAQIVEDAHTRVQLVSEVSSIQPGQRFWVGVDMVLDPHWHVYWINPGDSGLPPKIDWELPPGFEAGEIRWPYPERMDYDPLTGYVYHDHVLLMVPVDPPEGLTAGDQIRVGAKVGWLACEEICVPGQADLELNLTVADQARADHNWVDAFQDTRHDWPVENHGIPIEVFDQTDSFVITVKDFESDHLEFFIFANNIVEYPGDQILTRSGSGVQLTIPKSPYIEEVPDQLQGVLVSTDGFRQVGGRKAIVLDAAVKSPSVQAAPLEIQVMGDAPDPSGIGLGFALILAFIGGIILNLMPCVLPVLSLKVLALVQQTHNSAQRLMHSVLFTAGVLVTFWALAGLLLVLRYLGQQIGWGFQFQAPGFVIFMILLMFLIALNLFGLFEVGTSLTTVQVRGGSGGSKAFMTGVLATIVATPCTAPFMGTALGYAIAQPPWVALLVFTFLGLGMSFPYFVLATNTSLLKFVPKPGPWMAGFKTFLGFIMLASVIWLLWVLGAQLGMTSVIAMLVLLLLMGLGFWVVGETAGAKAKKHPYLRLTGFVIIIISVISAWSLQKLFPGEELASSNGSQKSVWTEFEPDLIPGLRAEGHPVFLDFTAKWCLTCQVNEKVALDQPEVMRAFEERGIILVKADWTQRDEDITRALEAFGKNSIPFYVLYPSEMDREPIILPEVLTPGIVLDAIQKLDS